MLIACTAYLLTAYVETRNIISPEQRGFQSAKGTADHLFMVPAILEDANINRRDLRLLYVDWKQAFPSIPHDRLFQTLELLGIPSRLINMVKQLYAGQRASVLTPHGETEQFEVTPGGPNRSPPPLWLAGRPGSRNSTINSAQSKKSQYSPPTQRLAIVSAPPAWCPFAWKESTKEWPALIMCMRVNQYAPEHSQQHPAPAHHQNIHERGGEAAPLPWGSRMKRRRGVGAATRGVLATPPNRSRVFLCKGRLAPREKFIHTQILIRMYNYVEPQTIST